LVDLAKFTQVRSSGMSNASNRNSSHRFSSNCDGGNAAVRTAIEYEYRPPRRTEYRFAEYKYGEI
jgi:hypothetical protein